jgi:hypothetical protein
MHRNSAAKASKLKILARTNLPKPFRPEPPKAQPNKNNRALTMNYS